MLFGESEVEAGVVKIKDLDANTEETVPEVRPASTCVAWSLMWLHKAGGGPNDLDVGTVERR